MNESFWEVGRSAPSLPLSSAPDAAASCASDMTSRTPLGEGDRVHPPDGGGFGSSGWTSSDGEGDRTHSPLPLAPATSGGGGFGPSWYSSLTLLVLRVDGGGEGDPAHPPSDEEGGVGSSWWSSGDGEGDRAHPLTPVAATTDEEGGVGSSCWSSLDGGREENRAHRGGFGSGWRSFSFIRKPRINDKTCCELGSMLGLRFSWIASDDTLFVKLKAVANIPADVCSSLISVADVTNVMNCAPSLLSWPPADMSLRWFALPVIGVDW